MGCCSSSQKAADVIVEPSKVDVAFTPKAAAAASAPEPALGDFVELSRAKGDARRRRPTTKGGDGRSRKKSTDSATSAGATLPGNLTGVTEDGDILAGAIPSSFSGAASNAAWAKSDPRYFGTIAEYVEDRKNDPSHLNQLRNVIKKCGACGKVCGYNLTVCNSCGAELPDEITHSNNIFMAFAYGIERVPFPAIISIRKQTESVLIFDDILALSPCHLNGIPTDWYIPDWRFLLRQPRAGLELLVRLEESLWECVSDQFLKNAAWRSKFLAGHDDNDAQPSAAQLEALRKHVVAGCNFPPSQFQFHIQYIMPPLLPYQYYMYQQGNHFTPNRFYPLEDIKELLKFDEPMAVTMDTPVEEIIEKFEGRVSYEKEHEALYMRVEESHRALANWNRADFTLRIDRSGSVRGTADESQRAASDVVDADKATLQSYGRPYNEKGKPSGTYYKHAKRERIPVFGGIKRADSSGLHLAKR
jgi:hypothetical protein